MIDRDAQAGRADVDRAADRRGLAEIGHHEVPQRQGRAVALMLPLLARVPARLGCAAVARDADAIAPALLGEIERAVRIADQRVERQPFTGGIRSSDAEAHVHRLLERWDAPLADQPTDAFGDEHGFGDRGLRQDHRELLTAVATQHVRAARAIDDRGSDRLDHAIADRVAVAVVDRLEVIDVADDQRDRVAVALGAAVLFFDALVEVAAIEQPGQAVADRELARLHEEICVAERRA